MWYALLFVIQLSTGQHTFSVFKMPFYSKRECEVMLQNLETNYGVEYTSKTSCIFIDPGQAT